MKNFSKLLLVLFPAMVIGQTQTQNYIKTITYKTPTGTTIPNPTPAQASQNITYFDGLGRPVQQIAVQQSNTGKDIITPIEYDGFGRQLKEYLPFASAQTNSGYVNPVTLVPDLMAQYKTNYGAVNANPYSEKQVEASPLNRVLKQAAPGDDWSLKAGHAIKISYQTNLANEVRLFKATAIWTPESGLYEIALADAGTYAAGELYKTVTYDENTTANPTETAGSTVEFKNKEGQVVLKRTYDAGMKHDTYFVHDIYGNLTYVIPPKAEGTITTAILDHLCYQYKHDYRNRLVEKKLPGKQWEFMVYDKLDRVVATGPANSPFSDITAVGWLITKYDVFGRPIYTGWNNVSSSSATRKILQEAQNSAKVLFETQQSSGSIDGVPVNYSNAIAPTTFKLLTVNYYDNYLFPGVQKMPASIESQTVLTNVKSLPTGTWNRVVTTAAAILAEVSTTFYDQKARPIRAYTGNHLGGYTVTDSKIDFIGKTLYTLIRHKRTSASTELLIREDFTYSPQDRLLTHTHQINGGKVQLMANNSYDALGQLISKKTGNSAAVPLQKVDYTYNIRGWLTEINKTADLQQGIDPLDLFTFKISYNTPTAGITGVNALYNGNISETLWRTGSDNIERGYGYQYDKLNRLKNAIYEKNGLTTNAYDESLTYDKNGNIMSLKRKGDIDPQIQPIGTDDLVYTYAANSNQLGKITDNSNNTSGFNDFNKTGDDYTYDANGNLIIDKNKNITAITYNHLNLPTKITFGTSGYITYIYNADGQKTGKTVFKAGTVVRKPSTTITDYLQGGFQYSALNSKTFTLDFFPTAEGYVQPSGSSYEYVYQYKDHLGNVRLSYSDKDNNGTVNNTEIIAENNYYPFGLAHKGYNSNVVSTNPAQKYKYNGKELQDDFGLNFYDFGARNYDPALGRWMNMDPLTEQMRRHSPYNYAFNNPIFFTDPDGMAPNDVIVNGENADKFVKQLSAGTSLTISRDEKTGKLKAEGTAETGADETLLKAINDDKITINIDATKANQIDEGFIVGGAFLGNTVNDDGTKTAKQVVNPDQTEVLEKLAEAPIGTIAMHETIEAYQGARFAPGAKASTQAGDGFEKAHDLANKTDPRGKIIQDKLSVASNVQNNATTVTVTVKSTGKKTPLYTEKNK
ncbi:RHS repeat-associated core domain-containing protein [Flavobacterium circumlabens]|uniref:RHS repeat-associated core domain-containing protein n=1 Tax=Flavobacterium circumlabens TaxID=2133765 RepID=A0A4Y7UFY2_9FLAO|nr:DUF6443 domain-containing protein [Flavobacterium circumlabens]TCN60147.1 RHS repeat-associated protein [Flavobacterium circumlabens]TEB45373.1 RHS repeat-associated core domain-containing protein [Flavobacterium circumlabens]